MATPIGLRGGLRSSALASSLSLSRRLRDGQRFGPRWARDGGRIFQSSSRDVETIIKKKGLSPEQVQEYYDRGIITKWLTTPREMKKTRVVDADMTSGWLRGVSIRTGLLGRKIGMRNEVDLWGNIHPVTLVQIQANHVMQIKGPKDHQTAEDYWTLQIGAGLSKWHKHAKGLIGHFAKANVPPKAHIVEFQVSPNAVVPVGTELLVTHFVAGQFVNVRGITKGKGTAGVMKLHDFKGQRMSHGASKNHRRPGSIASGNTSPARVFKGHPMAGRMGTDKATMENLQILKINTVDGILFIKGSIPGPKKGWVEIRDSTSRPHKLPPPYPTHLPEIQANRPIPKKKYLRLKYADPYEKHREVDWEARWNEARAALKSAQHGEGADEDEEEPFI